MVSPVFIGRRAELASLASLLERVSAGEPAFALIGGEAGIGKTRLSRELAALAADREYCLLTGRRAGRAGARRAGRRAGHRRVVAGPAGHDDLRP